MRPVRLTLDKLTGGYGEVTVVEDISLTVGQGEACCITGRNGVGKTTLLNLATGALNPRAGRVLVGDRDVTGLAANRRYRLGISYAPQENIVFDSLTVAENLTLHHRGRSLERYRTLFERFPRIGERLTQKAGTLSGGEKKILSFCRAMAEDNPLTFLDEPTEGVQPENIDHMAEVINAAKATGRSLVVVEQNLSLVEKIADSAIFLDHGRVVFSSPFETDTRDRLYGLMVI